MISRYALWMAFTENLLGIFTVDGSALDGTDGLSDYSIFDGFYDDISTDAQDPYQVVFGTDNLMAQVQAGNLTATVGRIDDPSYWNPNNPNSPINGVIPGFKVMRPVRLQAIFDDGTVDNLFTGLLTRATWNSTNRTCELYCQDMLVWASRVFPTIASTGKTTVGAVVAMLFQLVNPLCTPICDDGATLDDFSADGSMSVTDLIGSILAFDLGTVFINGDGNPVYQQHDSPLAADAAATIQIATDASEEISGIDVQDIGTRATVNKTGASPGTWTSVNAAAEQEYGRADIGAVSSDWLDAAFGQSLADELVFEGVQGKQPLEYTIGEITTATDNTLLKLLVESPPLTVHTIADELGGSDGDVIVQQLTHTITTGFHQVQYLSKTRPQKAFTVDGSALDGPDGLRYP